MTISKEAFLERRRSGIGGSDIAAIIGISPWKTPRDIYLAKKGLAEPGGEDPQVLGRERNL